MSIAHRATASRESILDYEAEAEAEAEDKLSQIDKEINAAWEKRSAQ